MTEPPPAPTPGDDRENTATAAGMAVGAVMAGAAAAILALVPGLIRKALAGDSVPSLSRVLWRQGTLILNEALGRVTQIVQSHSQQAANNASSAMRAATAPNVHLYFPASPPPQSTQSVLNSLQQAGLNALRSTDDAFRTAAFNATVNHAAGTQAAQKMLNELADQGITGYVDSSGRHWELASYCEMATRTAVSRLNLLTQLQLMGPAGMDLVVVDAPSGEQGCPKCAPFEGNVLTLSGVNAVGSPVSARDAYGRQHSVHVKATLTAALAAGLLHPNCRHSLVPFVEGAGSLPMLGTTRGFVNQGHPNIRGVRPDVNGESYKQQQHQRQLERKVRSDKAQALVALTPQAKRAAVLKVHASTRTLEQHVEKYHLTRQHYREHPTKAR